RPSGPAATFTSVTSAPAPGAASTVARPAIPRTAVEPNSRMDLRIHRPFSSYGRTLRVCHAAGGDLSAASPRDDRLNDVNAWGPAIYMRVLTRRCFASA